MLKRKLALAKTLLRLGPRRLLLVASHRHKLKKGAYRRLTPSRPWSDFAGGTLRTPFSLPSPKVLRDILGDDGVASLVADADRIAGGELRYFSHHWKAQGPWRANTLTGYETPLVHWSEIRDFDPQQGDIKWIWEASRFDWAVTLARAFAVTGNAEYERKFLELLLRWREENPPNQGINWYCGQECALRLMALVFAATVFRSSDAESLISSTIAALAERVEPTMGYAIGQHNNHGTSEAAGLYLAGCCLPDHPSAARWRLQGRSILEKLILEQFDFEGAYVQHSFVYQRLALRACLLAALACRRLEDQHLDERVEDRLSFAVDFLRELMIGPEFGRLPNYGANDGANALALSQGEYLDFRPIIQLGKALFDEECAFAEGPWDEELAWFGIRREELSPAEERDATYFAMSGGYARLTAGQFAIFMRAPKYTDGRPGQADALHTDVWYNGRPVAVDSGTYSYNDPEGWCKHFKSTSAHNTVVIEGQDQMPLASRFLYTDWTQAELLIGEPTDEDEMSAVGSTDFVRGIGVGGISQAYQQTGLGVVHRRVAGVAEDGVTVADMLEGSAGRRATLLWHLDGAWVRSGEVLARIEDGIQFHIHSETPLDIRVRTNEPPLTMTSEAYGETRPITLVEAHFVTSAQTHIATHFFPSQD